MDLSDNTKIYFSSRGKYSFLSNFYPNRIKIDEFTYFHVEGFYQSQKFINTCIDKALEIASIENPAECKRRARSYNMSTEEINIWENARVQIMKRALLIKFSSSKHMLNALCSTGNKELIELNTTDYFWAAGEDGSGQNVLGKLLMEVRNMLSEFI